MRRGSKSVQLIMTATLCIFGENLYSQAASSTASPAQDDSAKLPFTLKTATHLVLVDVVATDGKGRLVTDLKADDFVVTEDGLPQAVRSFSFQQPVVSTDLPQALATPLPAGVVTNVPRYKKGDIWNVIVLDALNSPMLDQSSTRQQLLKVIDRIPIAWDISLSRLERTAARRNRPQPLRKTWTSVRPFQPPSFSRRGLFHHLQKQKIRSW